MLRILTVLGALIAATCANAADIAGITACAGGTLAVTGTSANVALSKCGAVVIVYNITSQEAFYALGSTSSATAVAQSSSTVAPVASQMSLPGNQFVVLQIPPDTPGYLAAITGTSTTTLRIVQGYAAP